MTDTASVADAVGEIHGAFGRIDALVNNAGYGLIGLFEEMTEEQVRRQIDTNILGVMNVTRAVLPVMRQQKAGRIINVSSVAGRLSLPLYTLYCTSKWAIEGFSEALAFEVAQHGIQVKIIEPGAIKSEFFGRSLDVPAGRRIRDYGRWEERVFANIKAKCADPPGPELVAESIFRAATESPNWRMRYKPNGRLMILRPHARPRRGSPAYRPLPARCLVRRARLIVVGRDFVRRPAGLAVVDADEIEPRRRGHRPAGRAVARCERSANVGRRPFPLADELETPDHRPDLIVQERASAGLDTDLVARRRDDEAIERPHRRFCLALGGAEGREVVASDERLRGLRHGRGIEVDGQPPDAIALERWRSTAREDTIEVMARRGAEAGVEVACRLSTLEHDDRQRLQVEIHRVAHAERLPRLGEIEVGNLAQRMNAGVGSPRPFHGDGLAAEALDRPR